ncbi:MAG TPA: hypothetical protein VIM53_01555 [Candidatus Saccharimonadales bacterium]
MSKNESAPKEPIPRHAPNMAKVAIAGCADPVGETTPANEVVTEIIPETTTVPPVYGANSCTT